jgi:ParB-like chromosome segregation protein Spo0J
MTGFDVRPASNVTDSETIPPAQDSDSLDSLEMIDQLPVLDVPTGSIERGFFQRGAGTDPAHVRMLAEVASSSDLPPILVQKETSRLVDGLHRLEAVRLRGEKTIRARFVNCSDNDAFILAVKSNTLHGLPLSRADRISGAKRILAWHPDWSDRAIGVVSGLGAKTVAGLRRSADGAAQSGKRLGRDGKLYPLSGSEGRRRAAEYIAAKPHASLREVAQATDVSLGTVHDVRERMRRGADPLLAVGREAPQEEEADLSTLEPSASEPAAESILHRRGMRRTGQSTWATVSGKLANDPSLKYSERGKEFFRWMAMHAMNADGWRDFIDAVPAHWMKDLSAAASDVADEWREFSDQLRSRMEQSVYSEAVSRGLFSRIYLVTDFRITARLHEERLTVSYPWDHRGADRRAVRSSDCAVRSPRPCPICAGTASRRK